MNYRNPVISGFQPVHANNLYDYFRYPGGRKEELDQIGVGECGLLATEMAGGATRVLFPLRIACTF